MYTTIHDVNIESLKTHCTKIHYFGLGFIQIKLGPQYRMHFYTKDLPAIIGDEDVHNHRYDFTSRILFGTFIQEIFTTEEGVTHLLEEESCKEGVTPHTEVKPCAIHLLSRQEFHQGSSYDISHTAFHRVKTDNAITFLKRGPVVKEFAHVIRPIKVPKICPFSKKIPEQELWCIVEEILKKARA